MLIFFFSQSRLNKCGERSRTVAYRRLYFDNSYSTPTRHYLVLLWSQVNMYSNVSFIGIRRLIIGIGIANHLIVSEVKRKDT